MNEGILTKEGNQIFVGEVGEELVILAEDSSWDNGIVAMLRPLIESEALDGLENE